MHVHISPLEVLATWAGIILFGFLWRSAAARLADTPVGQAMAFIY